MALPQAVQAIGDAAEKAAIEAGIKTDQPASEWKHAVPASPEPKEPAVLESPTVKIDPDDYKERYKRYKASTDQTIHELRVDAEKARQTIAKTEQTIQELTNQVKDLKDSQASNQVIPAVDTDDAQFKAWYAKLPKSIIDEYTEEYLKDQYIIQTSARPEAQAPKMDESKLNELESKVNQVSQYQEKTLSQLYEEAMDKAFPNDAWITMTQGEDWNRFCSSRVSPVDQRTYGEIVKTGNAAHDANQVIWVLNQYTQALNAAEKPGEQANPLASRVTPEGGADGGDLLGQVNAQTQTFLKSEVDQFFKDVATTRKYSAEQAAAIEKQIIEAQAAGKIIQG